MTTDNTPDLDLRQRVAELEAQVAFYKDAAALVGGAHAKETERRLGLEDELNWMRAEDMTSKIKQGWLSPEQASDLSLKWNEMVEEKDRRIVELEKQVEAYRYCEEAI